MKQRIFIAPFFKSDSADTKSEKNFFSMSLSESKDLQGSRFFLTNKQSEAYQNAPNYGQPNYGNAGFNPNGRIL